MTICGCFRLDFYDACRFAVISKFNILRHEDGRRQGLTAGPAQLYCLTDRAFKTICYPVRGARVDYCAQRSTRSDCLREGEVLAQPQSEFLFELYPERHGVWKVHDPFQRLGQRRFLDECAAFGITRLTFLPLIGFQPCTFYITVGYIWSCAAFCAVRSSGELR